jgi:hypothetical protein
MGFRNPSWCWRLIYGCRSQRASITPDAFPAPPGLSLLRRDLNITYPPAEIGPVTAIRFIRTPYPIILG